MGGVGIELALDGRPLHRPQAHQRILPRSCPAPPTPDPSPQGGGGSPEREHRVDEIVPRALLAEMDLQAVGEEGEEIVEFYELRSV